MSRERRIVPRDGTPTPRYEVSRPRDVPPLGDHFKYIKECFAILPPFRRGSIRKWCRFSGFPVCVLHEQHHGPAGLLRRRVGRRFYVPPVFSTVGAMTEFIWRLLFSAVCRPFFREEHIIQVGATPTLVTRHLACCFSIRTRTKKRLQRSRASLMTCGERRKKHSES